MHIQVVVTATPPGCASAKGTMCAAKVWAKRVACTWFRPRTSKS